VWRETKISRKRKKGLISTNKARDDIISFYESLDERKFADAEKVINSIKEKRFGDTEFQEGYTKALEGILTSIRTGDERDFLNRAPFSEKDINRYRKDFREYVQEGVHSQFDVGYFMAWTDFLQYKLDVEKTK